MKEMKVMDVLNRNPEIIDELLGYLKSGLDKGSDIFVDIRKSGSGEIILVKYYVVNSKTTLCVVMIGNESVWCHYAYSKWESEEIEDFIMKPYLRQEKINSIL